MDLELLSLNRRLSTASLQTWRSISATLIMMIIRLEITVHRSHYRDVGYDLTPREGIGGGGMGGVSNSNSHWAEIKIWAEVEGQTL